MAKLILILLQVLALVVLAPCDPNDVYNFIGQFGDSDYWIGETKKAANQNGQITAACIEKFGTGSLMTSIGNQNEWNWLKAQFSANYPCVGCTERYWMLNKWDQPVANSNNLVALQAVGTTITSGIYAKSNLYKYICEIPITTTTASPYTPSTQDPPAVPTPVDSCINDNDVIVVLDSSGSIGADNYKKEKVFAYDLARAFQNKPNSRFGLTIFSTAVRRIAQLDNRLSAADLNTQILNAEYMAYQTNTNLAIDSAVAEFAALARPSVTKNLVIITDGVSNDPTATVTSITNALGQGIRTFSVGIGSGTNSAELLALAGGDTTRAFTSANFDELTDLLDPLRQVVCDPDEL